MSSFPVFGTFENYFKFVIYVAVIFVGSILLFILVIILLLFYLGILAL